VCRNNGCPTCVPETYSRSGAIFTGDHSTSLVGAYSICAGIQRRFVAIIQQLTCLAGAMASPGWICVVQPNPSVQSLRDSVLEDLGYLWWWGGRRDWMVLSLLRNPSCFKFFVLVTFHPILLGPNYPYIPLHPFSCEHSVKGNNRNTYLALTSAVAMSG